MAVPHVNEPGTGGPADHRLSVRRAMVEQHPTHVAPLLLGARLTARIDDARVVLRVTEVEAYGGVGEDPGSHAFRRQGVKNATMFGPPGRLYVYFTYGMHWCANLVTGPEGQGSAVLFRAGEIIDGVDVARARRPSAHADRDLARGPARLTTALGITGVRDGVDLLSRRSAVRLDLADPEPADRIGVSARTGVGGAGATTPWRFYLIGEPTVSPYRKSAR